MELVEHLDDLRLVVTVDYSEVLLIIGAIDQVTRPEYDDLLGQRPEDSLRIVRDDLYRLTDDTGEGGVESAMRVDKAETRSRYETREVGDSHEFVIALDESMLELIIYSLRSAIATADEEYEALTGSPIEDVIQLQSAFSQLRK